jgi:predicted house-cleaning NTP pyrophosphatase (Maf/HAM1 superfamily)
MNAHQRIVSDMSPQEQRQHLSEQVRVAERAWAKAENLASELEEGRSIIMAEMKLNLVKNNLAKSMSAAEDIARASDQWKGYVRKMHDARHAANMAKADWRGIERLYWSSVSEEASERAQMRMAR